MIYLIGLNHRYQILGYSDEWESFHIFLTRKARELKVDLIAEEMSQDGVFLFDGKDSVARVIAQKYGLRHLFVDPDQSERDRLGIKSFEQIAEELGYGRALRREEEERVKSIERTHWKRREKLWLEKLEGIDYRTCLLIVGTQHVSSFCDLLLSRRIGYEVIAFNYDGSP